MASAGDRLTPALRRLRVFELSGLPLLVVNVILAYAVVFFVQIPPIRILVGLPLVFFWPGFVLVLVGFRSPGLSKLDRTVFSVALSIPIVVVLALGLDVVGWRIDEGSVLTVLSLWSLGVGAVAIALGRISTPKSAVVESVSVDRKFVWRRTDVILTALVGASLVGFGTSVVIKLQQPVGDAFVEFYVLGPESKAENYTDRLLIGESTTVVLGVVNRESDAQSFLVKGVDGNRETVLLEPFIVKPGERWESPVEFRLETVGDRVRYELLLLREGADAATSSLYLWMTVDPV